MLQYFWQSEQWPHYRWRADDLLGPLAELRKAQGRVLGLAANLGFDEGLRASALALEEDAIQTAAIEGERLDREKVRSSLALRLGLPQATPPPADRAVDGLVEALLDAARQYDQPLDEKRLCGWHAALFPTGRSGLDDVTVGAWRTAAMRVVSGPFGKQKVHFEAPPPERLPDEMKSYFDWWQESRGAVDGLIRAALAQLYFVAIHPFDDGNGRLARALSDLALAQDEGTGQRFYSLSAQIMKERQEYYNILERTQKNDGDCTQWLLWFFGCLARAIEGTEQLLANVLLKARFRQKHAAAELSGRQKKVLNTLLDAGPGGFEGGLTTRKYMSLTKT
ncbi:MAG: Fic family protein, partial [Candidatus Adiutrix sp.]|nr:Fic family protein [Candidatus Adiutrix sp.]